MKRYYPWIAVALGLGVIVWMFFDGGGWTSLRMVHISSPFILGMAATVVCFVLQNLSMSYRYRLLSGNSLSFMQALRVNVMCEFTSAVTPSAVGGSSINFLFMKREGLSMGQSTFITLTSLFLDELFLALSATLLYICVPSDILFGNLASLQAGLRYAFCFTLVGISLWTALLFVAIFFQPQVVPRCLSVFFRLPFLRKHKDKLDGFAADIVSASLQARAYGTAYWLKAFINTCLSWCTRYAVVVFILIAFSAHGNLLIAYLQQWVAWVVMLVTPTPGGSGFSEFLFREYYASFLPNVGVTVIAALAWRIIFYYSYLIAGVLCLPKMIKA